VDPGSRQENATNQRAFSSEVDSGSRQENATNQSASSSEVDPGPRQENATNQSTSIGAQKKEASLAAGLLRETSIHAY
jgi:hypothetical protein